MTWRALGWGVVVATVIAISWLWPRIQRLPTDFEIALEYLGEQQPDLALLFFRDSAWRGVAAYRAGRYAQASRKFLANETVLSLYNLGNSQAQLRDWPSAIATYERVLRFDPEHADAQHNLALVRKLSEPRGHPVAAEEVPEAPPPESLTLEMSIPQESESQRTPAGESELNDTAGNTSDTDAVGDTETNDRPKPAGTTGEVGSAAAVGQSSEDRCRDNWSILGIVHLKPRKSVRPADVLLRRIHDDPEKVLRARMLSVYESRIAGTAQ